VQYITLDTFFGVLGQALIAGCSGLLVYGIIALLLRSEEAVEFASSIRRRFLKKVKPTETIVTELDT
jgi:hypothetical protein